MNLQAQKLRLIEWLVQTKDVQFVSQIADMVKARQASDYEAELKPMTMEELKARLLESKADIAAGKMHTLEEVEREFQ